MPAYALWLQGIIAAIWCLSGKYGDLLDMITSVVVIFYVLGVAGVIRLRYTRPGAQRPYKAFGYPYLPIIYIVMGVSFVLLMIVYKPTYTLPGIFIALTGIPIFYMINNKSEKNV